MFVVPDAVQDERIGESPLVTAAPHIRFYAGAPLISMNGYALGTRCIIDYVLPQITPELSEAPQVLSAHSMAQLELRRRLAQFTLRCDRMQGYAFSRPVPKIEKVGQLRRHQDAST